MLRLPIRALAAVLLLGTLFLAGCDESGPGRSVAEMVECNLLRHPFTAVRRFSGHDAQGPLSYVERLSCRGNGSDFALELLELNGKAFEDIVDPAERERFASLQMRMSAGEGHRILFQRDFRVIDLELMLQNYSFKLIRRPGSLRVGGDAAVIVQVDPRVPDRPSYEVTVSVEPGREGFPLACRQFGPASQEVAAEMEVQSLDYGNPGFLLPRRTPIISKERFSELGQLTTAFGFDVLQPTRLPQGYRIHQIGKVVMRSDAGGSGIATVEAAHVIYSDGVDRIEVIQHDQAHSFLSVDRFRGRRQVVPILRFGSTISAVLFLEDSDLIVEGRLSESGYERLLSSLRSVQ